jgi:hypothetical protein
MTEKCHICMESINMLHSDAFQCVSESRKYWLHQICLEDVGNIKSENKTLKLELKCNKQLNKYRIQRNSIVKDRNKKAFMKKDKQIKELITFKQEIELVTKQQNERIRTLENELKTYKGRLIFLNNFFLRNYFCF